MLIRTERLIFSICLVLFLNACSIVTPSKLIPFINHQEKPKVEEQEAPVLPSIDLALNKEVKKQLETYTKYNCVALRKGIERRAEFNREIEQIFIEEGLPLELLNLAMIESAFNPKARSHCGAYGIWQFMRSTARNYGLQVNKYRDQRADPILATRAAAKHLKDLYKYFNNWYLAIAAYNSGPYGLEKIMQKKGVYDFWELSRGGHLRKETAEFVPRFLAVTYLMKYPERCGDNQLILAQAEHEIKVD